MKTKLDELFYLTDYDSGDIIDYYLTNNAGGCYDAMADVDRLEEYFEEDWESKDEYAKECYSESFIKEFGVNKIIKLARARYEGDWEYAFDVICKARGIKVKGFNHIESYEW